MTILEKYQEYPRNCKLTVAEDIVLSIVDEMIGRKGIGNEFEAIDENIQEEILQAWVDITNEKISK